MSSFQVIYTIKCWLGCQHLLKCQLPANETTNETSMIAPLYPTENQQDSEMNLTYRNFAMLKSSPRPLTASLPTAVRLRSLRRRPRWRSGSRQTIGRLPAHGAAAAATAAAPAAPQPMRRRGAAAAAAAGSSRGFYAARPSTRMPPPPPPRHPSPAHRSPRPARRARPFPWTFESRTPLGTAPAPRHQTRIRRPAPRRWMRLHLTGAYRSTRAPSPGPGRQSRSSSAQGPPPRSESSSGEETRRRRRPAPPPRRAVEPRRRRLRLLLRVQS